MRTTISINDSLLKEAKRHSLERNCSLGEIVEEALLLNFAASQKQSAGQRTKRALKTFKGDGLCEGADLSNSSSLLDVMEP